MSDQNKTLLRFVILLTWLAILIIPGYIFFQMRGGIGFLEGVDFKTGSRLLFPLVGLYAFTLVWTQLILGSSAAPWRKIFPAITKIHRRVGTFTFLFALLHPGLMILAFGPDFLGYRFLDPTLTLFAYAGTIAILIISLTALTAIFWRVNFIRRYWRTVHYLNYVTFALVWYHSWNIGSDVQTTNLKWLWLFFGTSAIFSLTWRLLRSFSRKPLPASAT